MSLAQFLLSVLCSSNFVHTCKKYFTEASKASEKVWDTLSDRSRSDHVLPRWWPYLAVAYKFAFSLEPTKKWSSHFFIRFSTIECTFWLSKKFKRFIILTINPYLCSKVFVNWTITIVMYIRSVNTCHYSDRKSGCWTQGQSINQFSFDDCHDDDPIMVNDSPVLEGLSVSSRSLSTNFHTFVSFSRSYRCGVRYTCLTRFIELEINGLSWMKLLSF